jgi:PBSX family phage portal protein
MAKFPKKPSGIPGELGARVTTIARKDFGGYNSGIQGNAGLLNGPGQPGNPNGAVETNALEYEDDFSGMYGLAGMVNNSNCILLEPPFNPLTLDKLTTISNALQPCIDAMVTNVDGTGFEIIDPTLATDEDATDGNDNLNDPNLTQAETPQAKSDMECLKDFFDEPWPGVSFATIRKDLRKDMETFGYGFLEVVRNPAGQILMLRNVDARTVRLVKLDMGSYVTKKLKRGGKLVDVKVRLRFRRYCQRIGTQYVFFKDFGAPLPMNKSTGAWSSPKDTPLKPNQRGSELMYFRLKQDVNSPYGIPRWINQLPSVLGSRQAEENNLEFFESGGIPPFIMLISGGILAQEAKEALETGLANRGAQKQRGMVVEIHSTSGSLNDSGDVKVQLDKMGNDKQKDSLFENYDDKCEKRIRGSFRLPAIFVGKADSYNFATAFASYMVGEAQIFAPERHDFDQIITLKLLPEIIGRKDVTAVFRSLPIVVNDSKERLLALKMTSDKGGMTFGEFYRTLNEITGLKMQIPPSMVSQIMPAAMSGGGGGNIDNVSNMLDASTASPTGEQG